MKSKTIRITVLLAMVVALLALMTACGDKTLEGYFKDNPDQVTEVEKAMNSSSGGLMECTFNAKGNTANYIMKFTKTYSDSEISQMKNAFEQQMDSKKSEFVSMISQLEEQSKIEGIVCHLEYQNGDGTVIYETDLTKE